MVRTTEYTIQVIFSETKKEIFYYTVNQRSSLTDRGLLVLFLTVQHTVMPLLNLISVFSFAAPNCQFRQGLTSPIDTVMLEMDMVNICQAYGVNENKKSNDKRLPMTRMKRPRSSGH